MWARMQRDRNQRSQRGSVFNLGDAAGPSETLTHRGQALGSDYRHDDGVHSNDDKDDDLDAEVVDKLHFGGGTRDSRLDHPQVQMHTSYYTQTHTPCYLWSQSTRIPDQTAPLVFVLVQVYRVDVYTWKDRYHVW